MRLVRTYFFRSDSDPDRLYQTLEHTDTRASGRALTCDCPGWTRRNAPGGRTCKHVRLVAAGSSLAVRSAVRVVDEDTATVFADLYDADVRAAMAPPVKTNGHSVRFGQMGRRKFAA